MSRLSALARGLKARLEALLSRRRLDSELDEEIRFHLERQTEKNLRAGMSPAEAKRAAHVAFGGVARVVEEHRDSRGVRLIDDLLHDLAFALRSLRASPGNAIASVLALAIGIGATSSVFSMVNGLVLEPLPYPQLGRIVVAFETAPQFGLSRLATSPATFRDWRAQPAFEELAAYRGWNATLTGVGDPERIHGARVTPEFFAVLGIEPELGRTFAPGEELPGDDAVVVLSHDFWQARLAGDPAIIGRRLRVGDREVTVVGVAPEAHAYPLGTDLWAPLALTEAQWASRTERDLRAIGRLAPGQSLQQARVQMDALAVRLATTYPDALSGRGARLSTLLEQTNRGTRQFVLFLMGAAGFVLLLACANVANLQLARGTVRQREMALRMALGAGPARLVRQLLTESVVLVSMAAVAGVLIAEWSNRLSRSATPYEVRRFIVAGIDQLALDGRVVAFTIATALGAALAFGLVPALRSSRAELSSALKQGDRGSSGAGGGRIRAVLVVVEVGLSIVLLAGAGLMMQGFGELSRYDLGFDDRGLLAVRIEVPPESHPEEHQLRDFFEQALAGVQGLPEADSAALVSSLPALGGTIGTGFDIEGRPEPPPDRPRHADLQLVSTGFLETLGIPLLEGRGFGELDNADSDHVAVVSAALAQRYWPDGSPIGQRIRLPSDEGRWITVVGIVGDVSHDWIEQVPAWTLYRPFAQAPVREMTIVVKTSADPTTLVPQTRERVWAVDPGQPIGDTRTVSRIFADMTSGVRLATQMMGVFAAAALLLCSGGIFAVLAYSVARRTQEIGVRIALGAGRLDILRLFVRGGVRLILTGLAFGLPAAYLMARTLSSFVLDVLSVSLPVLAGLGLFLLTVGALASYIPARRAAAVDPMVALRSE